MKAVRILTITAIALLISACGNKGSINFHDESSQEPADPKINQNAGFNMVDGSRALIVESGKNVSTGYHGKLELNPMGGQKMTGGGYSTRLKFTTRAH